MNKPYTVRLDYEDGTFHTRSFRSLVLAHAYFLYRTAGIRLDNLLYRLGV